MNDYRSIVVQLGILAVPIGIFFAIWWICDYVFQPRPPLSLAIAATTMILVFVVFFCWMIAIQKKEDEVLGTIEHPFFGTVKKKRKSWDASLTVQGIGELAISSYEGDIPTKNQEQIVCWLTDSADSIREELEGCLDDFDRDTNCLPLRPRKLVFESLLLDPNEPMTFCLGFDIEDADLPWGFSAFYNEGEIREVTDNH